ncbi:MAG: polyamine aminopropyltransferase [Candidatus Wildermuthbacteria bacterium]|nr:polyamine aminopropyltransferase [Candidatus Wildermuthbacteria bacterium]
MLTSVSPLPGSAIVPTTLVKRDAFGDEYDVMEVVLDKVTPYQHIEILDAATFGRCLFLDDIIQSAESDEYIYHESMVHPAMIMHPCPKRVLIIGGGEGGILREVLRHNTVTQVTMVDIDREVVRACKKYLAEWNQVAFDDPRTEVIYADGRAFVNWTRESWDVIISDLTDPVKDGPSSGLFSLEFYEVVNQRLAEDGILVVQGESVSPDELDLHLAMFRTIARVFPRVRVHSAEIPSFDDTWGVIVASKRLELGVLAPCEVDRTIAARGCSGLRFYDGTKHSLLNSLPHYLRLAQSGQGQIITDDQPVFIRTNDGSQTSS